MRNKNKPGLSLKLGYFLPVLIMGYVLIMAIVLKFSSLLSLIKNTLFLNLFYPLLNNLQPKMFPIGELATLCLVIIIIIIFNYQNGNSLSNYFDSIDQTYNLRHFCRREPLTILNDEKQTKQKNSVIGTFNGSLKELFVDIRKDSITVWILIPDRQEAKQILNNEMNDIVQWIKQANPDYTFSSIEPMENSSFYCLHATKFTA